MYLWVFSGDSPPASQRMYEMDECIDSKVRVDIKDPRRSGAAPWSYSGDVRTPLPRPEPGDTQSIGARQGVKFVDQHESNAIRPAPDGNMPPRQDVPAPLRGLSHETL